MKLQWGDDGEKDEDKLIVSIAPPTNTAMGIEILPEKKKIKARKDLNPD